MFSLFFMISCISGLFIALLVFYYVGLPDGHAHQDIIIALCAGLSAPMVITIVLLIIFALKNKLKKQPES